MRTGGSSWRWKRREIRLKIECLFAVAAALSNNWDFVLLSATNCDPKHYDAVQPGRPGLRVSLSYHNGSELHQENPDQVFCFPGELGGTRTHDPRLKRAVLYQLSYELITKLTHWKLLIS